MSRSASWFAPSAIRTISRRWTWLTTRPSGPGPSGLLKTHGAPDLLLNNAALINRNAPLWKVPAEEFDAVIDVNIKGVANVDPPFRAGHDRAGRGVIVNFSSGWGRSHLAGGGALLRDASGPSRG